MKNNPKIVFIIICWNNKKLLNECLNSIKTQAYKNHSTIMVDNDSKDNSIEEALRTMPDIQILDTKKNNGFARGNNIGIKEALKDPDVKYIALLNTDARLEKDWLGKVIELAERKPMVACLQGTTLNYSDRRIIDSTHLYMTQGAQGAQGHWQDVYYEEIGPKKVFGVNAAACLISRKFIEAQPYRQFFDESLFMYLEDVDIGARSTIMGWDNYLVPGARAYHMGSASSGGETGFSNYGLYMTFRNNLGVILKNYRWGTIFRLLISLPVTDYRTIQHLIRLNRPEAARKVIAGRLVGIYRAPIYLIKRWKLHGKRKIDTEYLWQLMKKGY